MTDGERFPGFDVLSQAGHWDAATAGVVLSRLTPTPGLRFFTPDEEAVGRALFDRLLDQCTEPRIPILELVDARMCEAQTDGWHYADLPEDGDAFRASFAALDADAQRLFATGFASLEAPLQDDIIRRVQRLRDEQWHGLRADRVWGLWTRYACTAYYAHPWAWNEIGFGGPAYPRGYKHLGIDAREPWEVRDQVNSDPVGSG